MGFWLKTGSQPRHNPASLAVHSDSSLKPIIWTCAIRGVFMGSVTILDRCFASLGPNTVRALLRQRWWTRKGQHGGRRYMHQPQIIFQAKPACLPPPSLLPIVASGSWEKKKINKLDNTSTVHYVTVARDSTETLNCLFDQGFFHATAFSP